MSLPVLNAKKNFVLLTILLSITTMFAGECPQTWIAYRGETPILDGVIGHDEYADADSISGFKDWFSDTHTPSQDALDFSVKAWVKHDGSNLFFAFDVTDDLLYAFDIDRWAPSNNPTANELTYDKGWSWWGDGVEIMMNSTYKWNGENGCTGDGRSWQVVCSTNKSTLGGMDVPGLMAGEPRNEYSWAIYESWARNGDMKTAVRFKEASEGKGYIVEWRIKPNPCMQIDASSFVDLSKETKVGINIEIVDLDEKEKGEGNWSNMHHIDYWARVKPHGKTALKSFATLLLKPDTRPTLVTANERTIRDFALEQNYPNPFNLSTTIHYRLGKSEHTELAIYNQQGQKVSTLVDEFQSEGMHHIVWNGWNDNGELAPSGIYLCRLAVGQRTDSRKMLLIK